MGENKTDLIIKTFVGTRKGTVQYFLERRYSAVTPFFKKDKHNRGTGEIGFPAGRVNKRQSPSHLKTNRDGKG